MVELTRESEMAREVGMDAGSAAGRMADLGSGAQSGVQSSTGSGAGAAESWGAWLAAQPEEQRAEIARLHEAETAGLRSALRSEREARGGLEKQLREIGKQLEEGSAGRQQLEAAARELAAAQQRVAFYESAPGDLVNPQLAWLAAQELDAFDKRGAVVWEALREVFPELFRPARPAAAGVNAGTGAGGRLPQGFDMNAAIRRAAGRGGRGDVIT